MDSIQIKGNSLETLEEADKLRSLRTESLQQISREILEIYKDDEESDLLSERASWNTNIILDNGDVRPFFDAIAKLSTVSVSRIMLVYLMKVNGIAVDTKASKEAIRFVEASGRKAIENYLKKVQNRGKEAGAYPREVLKAISERTEQELKTEGFILPETKSWNTFFTELIKEPDLSTLKWLAFAYRMKTETCELFMRKALRRSHFNLYDREEFMIWTVLEFGGLTDNYFSNYGKLRKMYTPPTKKSEEAEKDISIVSTVEEKKTGGDLVPTPEEIKKKTILFSTKDMEDVYQSVIESILDNDDVFEKRSTRLAGLMDWAEQRASEEGLQEEHRIRRTDKREAEELIGQIINDINNSRNYEERRKAEELAKDAEKYAKRQEKILRVQYELQSDQDDIVIPAKTELISKSKNVGKVIVSVKAVLKNNSSKELEVPIKALTNRRDVSQRTLDVIGGKINVPGNVRFEILDSDIQGKINSALPKSAVHFFEDDKSKNRGILSVNCTAETYIPCGSKFVFGMGEDTFEYETLEPVNLVEKIIPVELISVEKSSEKKKSEETKATVKKEENGKRKKATKLPMSVYDIPGAENANKKQASGIVSANSGYDKMLPRKGMGNEGSMIVHCTCNACIPKGTGFCLDYDGKKYIYKTTKEMKTGVVQEADITVKWTNADDLLKAATKNSKKREGDNAITLIPNRTEFCIREGELPGIVRVYTPKAMTYGKEKREEDDKVKTSANYDSVLEWLCGDIKDQDYKGVTSYGKDFLLNTKEFKDSRIKDSNRYDLIGDSLKHRNQLLTLAFFEYAITQEKQGEKENIIEIIGDFRRYADGILKKCGMYDLYEGYALDVFFLLMISADLPIDIYRLIWDASHPLTEYFTFTKSPREVVRCRILRFDKTAGSENAEVWAEWTLGANETFASVPRFVRDNEKYRYVLEVISKNGTAVPYEINLNDSREYNISV